MNVAAEPASSGCRPIAFAHGWNRFPAIQTEPPSRPASEQDAHSRTARAPGHGDDEMANAAWSETAVLSSKSSGLVSRGHENDSDDVSVRSAHGQSAGFGEGLRDQDNVVVDVVAQAQRSPSPPAVGRNAELRRLVQPLSVREVVSCHRRFPPNARSGDFAAAECSRLVRDSESRCVCPKFVSFLVSVRRIHTCQVV